MERLPGQISGIGYFVKAYLTPFSLRTLDLLLHNGRHGKTHEQVAREVLADWFFQNTLDFQERRGEKTPIFKDVKEKGYTPIEFEKLNVRRRPKKQFDEELFYSQPLVIAVTGLSAYFLDEYSRLKFYGSDRETIVQKGLNKTLPKRIIL